MIKTKESESVDRRGFIQQTSLGVIAAGLLAVPAASAQTSAEAPAAPLENPAAKYPKPPFPEQRQPWPGLASKMNPRPDHGETSYRGSGRLRGRRALITGGDSGIGRAAAIAYAREGADVAISYFPTEEPDAQEVVQLIKAAGRKVLALPGDLREEAYCKRLVADTVAGLGGLDIVVSNAGRQQSHQSILEISEQAYDPSADLYDYSQTKAATMNSVKSLAKQLGPRGIRVNGVAPGPIWTPLQISGGATPEKVKNFGADTVFKRPGQPAELASTFVELAANSGSSFTTGQIYGVSGGKGQP